MLTFETRCRKLEGIVTFGTTKESLCNGLGLMAAFRIAEDTLPVTRFAQDIDEVYSRNRHPVCPHLSPLVPHVPDNAEDGSLRHVLLSPVQQIRGGPWT
jgi:hypothetical protein